MRNKPATRPFVSYGDLGVWLHELDGAQRAAVDDEHQFQDLPPVHVIDGPAASWTIDECGEPLIALPDSLVDVGAYRRGGWAGTPPRCFVRSGIADRLQVAAAMLPSSFSLAVFDGWRSATTIEALWHHYYGPGSTLPPGYVADPSHPSLVPPHATGGAVDVTLAVLGVPINLGTAFDDFTDEAAAAAFEDPHRDPMVRNLRRLLHFAMSAAGFVGLESEWWHFSCGDQSWGASTGSSAIYGAARPSGPQPKRSPLPETQLGEWIGTHPKWSADPSGLHATFRLRNFVDAIEVVQAVSYYCEELDHHPRWTNEASSLDVTLLTNDRSAITALDTRLAELIEMEIASRMR